MKKRLLQVLILSLVAVFSLAGSASANSDPTEPGNNTESTSYYLTQGNGYFSWIQGSNDLDFWRFTSNKSGYQTVWMLPPMGKNYAIGVYPYGSGTPLYFTQSYGNYVNFSVPVQAGQTYTILVFSVDGSYSDTDPYHFGIPN